MRIAGVAMRILGLYRATRWMKSSVKFWSNFHFNETLELVVSVIESWPSFSSGISHVEVAGSKSAHRILAKQNKKEYLVVYMTILDFD